MGNEIWHVANDFLELSARDGIKNILRDDRKNYERAESEFSEDIKLLDDAMVLYVEVLQAAFRVKDRWESNDSNRAAMAMLISTLNYILLARHGILLGYYPEARDLLRSCYERTSRCYLFFYDNKLARRFLEGEEIWQSEVDQKLSEIEKDSNKRELLHKGLRQYYKFMSRVTHPNLKSFEARYGDKELGDRVGLDVVFGGFMSSNLGQVLIMRIIKTVLSALLILGVMFPEESGGWDRERQRIEKRCDGIIANLSFEQESA